jgi:hypothetical protein
MKEERIGKLEKIMTKFTVYIFIIVITISCGSAPIHVKEKGPITYLNFGERFEWFWEKAKNKPFDQRVKLWDKYIEGKYVAYYDNILWKQFGEKESVFRKEMKNFLLSDFFMMYDAKYDEISEFQENLVTLIDNHVEQFRSKIPDANLGGLYYMLPLGSTDTSAFVTHGHVKPLNKNLIFSFFAVDRLAIMDSEAVSETIFHELFHVYHIEKLMKYYKKDFPHQMNNNLPQCLLLEGMADWGAKNIFDQKISRTKIKFSIGENFKPEQYQKLVRIIRDEVRRKGNTFEVTTKQIDKIIRTHFTKGRVHRDRCRGSREDIRLVKYDARAIYRVGYRFVDNMIKEIGLNDSMLLWGKPTLSSKLKQFLSKQNDNDAKLLLEEINKM